MREASFQELLSSSFEYQMDNIYTALPGIVVKVRNDLSDMTLDVQPTINIKNKDGSIEERPIIMNVPFQFPSSSTSAFTYPINVGDPILLIFTMRGIDIWKRGTGRPTVPGDFRKFDKRDCIAIPGIFPTAKSINDPSKRIWAHDTQDTVIVHNIGQSTETEIRLQVAGGIVINTSQPVEVNCSDAVVNASASIELNAPSLTVDCTETTWIGNITQSGNYTQTGTATFNGIVFATHKHTGVQTGAGTSGGPTN